MPSKKFDRQRPVSLIILLNGFCFLLLACSIFMSCKSDVPKEKINWLDDHPGWDTVLLRPRDPTNVKLIELEKRKIRAYVRGWLDEYNIDSSGHYTVTEFEFIPDKQNPLRVTVKAYLNPPVTVAGGHEDDGGGTHLHPPEPPPPK